MTVAVARRKLRPKKRRFSNPAATYAKRLERYRPGLVGFTLSSLRGRYGAPVWERRLDPTSELILTILTQNSADTNAEVGSCLAIHLQFHLGLAAYEGRIYVNRIGNRLHFFE